MSALALDQTDDSLCETPHRIAKMYVDEIFSGLDYSNFPKISVIDNKMGVEEMVKVDDINLVSTCEHHFITIDGFAKVAYIPSNKIIGLSKINRIVKFFAQRPQVQERMTQTVADLLEEELGAKGVAVVIEATHTCMTIRGVRKPGSLCVTSAIKGLFRQNASSRSEIMSLIYTNRQ